MKDFLHVPIPVDEKQFLMEILEASPSSVYGVDYNRFVTSRYNALSSLEFMPTYIKRDREHDTIDVNLAGLVKLDNKLSNSILDTCDQIFAVLRQRFEEKVTSLHSYDLFKPVAKSQKYIDRCLWIMNTSPGLVVTPNEEEGFNIRLTLEILRHEKFTDFARGYTKFWNPDKSRHALSGPPDSLETGIHRKPAAAYQSPESIKKIIYAAALYLIQEHPDAYRDNDKKLDANALAGAIYRYAPVFWPSLKHCPVEVDIIQSYLSNILSKKIDLSEPE